MPQLRITLDGTRLPAEVLQSLLECRIQQALNCPALCELVFSESAPFAGRPAWLSPGSTLEVAFEQQQTVFAGHITACHVEYGASQQQLIKIRGYDALDTLRKRRQVSAYNELRLSDLISSITAEIGIHVEVVKEGPSYEQAIQANQSDFEFIQQLASRNGIYFYLRGDALYLFDLEGFGETVPLSLGESLLHVNAEINADPLCRGVEVSGWDPRTASPLKTSANSTNIGREVAGEISVGGFDTDGQNYLVDQSGQNDAQLTAQAQAKLDTQAAREIWFSAVAEGNPRLQPGTPVTVEGLMDRFNGRYVLTEATHIINHQEGYVTQISTLPPKPLPRARGSIVTLGRVTNVDDPQRLGRVRVTLTNIGEVETLWCQVLIPAAGSNKGLIALPNVDDQVLVLLLNEDAAEAVVLGGLFGDTAPADDGVDSGERRRFVFTTAQGQRVVLDDVENTVRLENQQGSYFEMTPQTCCLHAETPLTIKAPGNSVEIIGKRIDFNHG